MQSRMYSVLSVLNKLIHIICIYMHRLSLEGYRIVTVDPLGKTGCLGNRTK